MTRDSASSGSLSSACSSPATRCSTGSTWASARSTRSSASPMRTRRSCAPRIGPVWDGNEVWLLTGGGALFAAFPAVYATVFSGFYLALMLVLFALIFRAVSFEFHAHDKARGRVWDWAFFLGSALPRCCSAWPWATSCSASRSSRRRVRRQLLHAPQPVPAGHRRARAVDDPRAGRVVARGEVRGRPLQALGQDAVAARMGVRRARGGGCRLCGADRAGKQAKRWSGTGGK